MQPDSTTVSSPNSASLANSAALKQAQTLIPQRFSVPALDLVLFCGRQISSMNIHAVLTMASPLNLERLQRAVRLTLDAEPILGCRFVDHPIRPTWQRRSDLDHSDFLQHLCAEVNTPNVANELMRFLTQPIDPEIDPLVEVRLLSQANTGYSHLVVKLNHLAADGGGLKAYTYLLAQTYTQLITEPDYYPIPNLGHRGIQQITTQYNWLQKRQITQQLRTDLQRRNRISNRWGFPNQNAPQTERLYLWKQLPAEQVQALKAYSRRQGATLHLVLTAAFYRSLYAHIPHLGSGALPVLTTIDLRRYVPEPQRQQSPLCNLSSITTLLLDHNSQPDSFANTLATVREQMKERKSRYIGLTALPLLLAIYNGLPFFACRRLVHKTIAQTVTNQTTAPTLTNAGSLEPERLNFGDVELIDAFLTASVQYSPYFAMGVTEFRKTLTLSVGFCQTLIAYSTVEAVLNQMVQELASALN
jgi:NRPS condensation-like uncharacterized protein